MHADEKNWTKVHDTQIRVEMQRFCAMLRLISVVSTFTCEQ
jgi:hypothetical protein